MPREFGIRLRPVGCPDLSGTETRLIGVLNTYERKSQRQCLGGGQRFARRREIGYEVRRGIDLREGKRRAGRLVGVGFGFFAGVMTKILGAQVLADVGTFVAAIDTTFGGFRAPSWPFRSWPRGSPPSGWAW